MGLAEEVASDEESGDLRDALGRAQRTIARLKRNQGDLVDAVYRGARDAALAVGTPKPVARPARDRRRSPEVALLHMTDWQLGKSTASYSTEIGEARVRMAVNKAIKLSAIQREDHPVRECHVMLGGDLVEGVSIFPGQSWEIDSSSFQQVFAASALVEQVLVTLLGSFESVQVWEVSGNHGRIGRKGDHPREDNLDRIVGRIARERLAKQQRLTWTEPQGWHQIVSIGEYRALLVHGDQVKSFGGNVPAYGIMRKANAWATGVTEPFKDLYLGHMHQEMTLTMANGGRVYMTPSTESGSEYAREFMGAHGRPGQRLHFIDPGKGSVTAAYMLELG